MWRRPWAAQPQTIDFGFRTSESLELAKAQRDKILLLRHQILLLLRRNQSETVYPP